MATAWPDPSAPATNVNLQTDGDSITAARAELEDAINKLNLILTSVDQGGNVLTTQNSGDYMKKVAGTNTNEIVLLDANGHPITSDKTIATSVSNDANSIPTNAAVFAALAGAGGSDDIVYIDNNMDGYIIFNTIPFKV